MEQCCIPSVVHNFFHVSSSECFRNVSPIIHLIRKRKMYVHYCGYACSVYIAFLWINLPLQLLLCKLMDDNRLSVLLLIMTLASSRPFASSQGSDTSRAIRDLIVWFKLQLMKYILSNKIQPSFQVRIFSVVLYEVGSCQMHIYIIF